MQDEQRTETRWLEYQLTSDEVIDRAKLLADIEGKLAEVESERKEAMSTFKYRKGELENTRRKLSKEVRSGKGGHEVECVWVPIWKQQQWVLQRTDTEEVLEQRTMTKDELQTSLDVERNEEDEETVVDDSSDEDKLLTAKARLRKPKKSKKV